MLQLGLILFTALNLVAIYHSLRAVQHLNPGVGAAGWKFITRGTFADRSVFTEVGWRHRNLAILFHSLAFGAVALGVLL